MKKIDTHQHLLYPDRFKYGWADELPALQGAFNLEDYQKIASDCDIAGTVFMEVDVDPGDETGEARFFSEMVSQDGSELLGVIAKACPEEDDFEVQVESLENPAVAGLAGVPKYSQKY